MNKIDAYLSKQWNRWFATKILLFLSKIAGTFVFLYALGIGGYYENGGNLTGKEIISVIICIILLAAIPTLSEHIETYKRLYARRYRRAYRARNEMLDAQGSKEE